MVTQPGCQQPGMGDRRNDRPPFCPNMPNMSTPRAGLEALLEMLHEQSVRRGTGAISVGDTGVIFMVFGHPLHAVHDALSGLAAVDAIGHLARVDPSAAVGWSPGRTAGKAHSLSPGDAVLERLRGVVVGELSDRPEGAPSGPPEDPGWGELRSAICGSVEASLHLHARVLTDLVGAAPADAAGILAAIARARSTPVRVVSPAVVARLLDDAEAMVRRHAAARG